MNRCEECENLLDEYFDGRLAPHESLAVERHLQECDACRRDLESLSSLRRLARNLPSSVEPARDLWPGINGQLSAPAILTGAGFFSGRRIIRLFIAAAAVLLLATGVFLHYQHRTRSDVVDNNHMASSERVVIDDELRAEIAKAEQTYRDAADDLLAVLDANETLLTPEARTILDGNLAIADQAISEVKSALEQRPTDVGLARKLLATYGRRVELLQQATQLSFAARNGG